MGRVRRVVVEDLAGDRIRVEVVVPVHGIDLVLPHRVEHRGPDELPDLGQPGVVVELPAVAHDPVGVPAGGVRGGEPRQVGVVRDTVRVEPGVQLQAARMGLPHRGAQRVPAWVLALDAGQVLGPRLVRRGPQRVGHGAHLEDHGVEAETYGGVEMAEQFGTLLAGEQARARGPVAVGDGRQPHPAQLAHRPRPARGRRSRRSRTRGSQPRKGSGIPRRHESRKRRHSSHGERPT